MPNEVTPTQADCEAAEQVRAAARSLSLTRRMENGLCLPSPVEKPWLEQAFAAHRIAHEAPLLARIAELEAALTTADETFDQVLDDMRGAGQCVCLDVKREITETHAVVIAALATKVTSHDA